MDVPPYLIFYLSQLPVSAVKHDLWSNNKSNFNFDCRNGFLGVDYISIAEMGSLWSISYIIRQLHSKIGGFSQGEPKNWNLNDNHQRGLHVKNCGLSSKNVAVHPYLIFQLSQLPVSAV